MLLFCLFFFSEDENRASVFLLLILLKISHIFVVNQLLKRKNGVSFATLPGLFLLVRRVRRRDCRLVRNERFATSRRFSGWQRREQCEDCKEEKVKRELETLKEGLIGGGETSSRRRLE